MNNLIIEKPSFINYKLLNPKLYWNSFWNIILLDTHFPTESHKVDASYGYLVTRLTNGRFEPQKHKILWSSTENNYRGEISNADLMQTPAAAILP